VWHKVPGSQPSISSKGTTFAGSSACAKWKMDGVFSGLTEK